MNARSPKFGDMGMNINCQFKSSSLRLMGTGLKDARVGKKISQKELAKKLGVSECFISRIESGAKPLPDSYLCQVASALEMSLSILKQMKMNYYREVMEHEIASKSA